MKLNAGALRVLNAGQARWAAGAIRHPHLNAEDANVSLMPSFHHTPVSYKNHANY